MHPKSYYLRANVSTLSSTLLSSVFIRGDLRLFHATFCALTNQRLFLFMWCEWVSGERLVSFAAARAGVTQRSPFPRERRRGALRDSCPSGCEGRHHHCSEERGWSLCARLPNNGVYDKAGWGSNDFGVTPPNRWLRHSRHVDGRKQKISH